jgi:hypothetical protein
MAYAQRPPTKPRCPSTLSLGWFLFYTPVVGYWLVAAIAMVVRPSAFEFFMLGLPLVVLSIIGPARVR